MGARQKLNGLYLKVGFVIAFVLGLLTSSMTIFIVTLAVAVGLGLHNRNIRLTGRDFQQRGGRGRRP